MAIIPSLGTAVSGINAFQNGLSVVSDNIANVDTKGYKKNDILFADMISQFSQCGGARYQTGSGTKVNEVRADFRQGTAEHTGNKLDLMVDGSGFFQLFSPDDGGTIPFYSRNGAFQVDAETGFIVNADGLQLQGLKIDPLTGAAIPGAGPIDLSAVISPAKQTENVKSSFNLDADAADPVTSLSGVAPTAPEAIPAGSIFINGVDLGDVAEGIDALIAAINAQSELTGVHADENSTEFLKLTNPNGGPINIFLDKTVDEAIVAKTGLNNANVLAKGGKPLTGTVTPSDAPDGSLTFVRGAGTRFKSELRAGDTIVIGDRGYIVKSIQSDTVLTVTEEIPVALSDPGLTINASARGSVFSTQVTVFDSLGGPHSISVNFSKLAPTTVIEEVTDPDTGEVTSTTTTQSNWRWSAVVGKNDNGNDDGSGVFFDEVQSTGTMVFNSDGSLDAVNSTQDEGVFNFKSLLTSQPLPLQGQEIAFDFSEEVTQFSAGLQGTQRGQGSTIVEQSQDGFAAGTLIRSSVAVDGKGFVRGLFTNGVNQPLAQVLLSTFRNENGLIRVGGNNYIQTKESGEPLLAEAGTGGRGVIQGQALENSNVDLTQEFVKLITYQRAFQANSKVITTSDEVIQEIVNLKR